jgi:hypothetical protein
MSQDDRENLHRDDCGRAKNGSNAHCVMANMDVNGRSRCRCCMRFSPVSLALTLDINLRESVARN